MSEITQTSLSNLNNDEIAAHLPPEVLQFLVRSVPSRALWKWLSEEEQTALLHDLTRGFQRTANALRQSIVRNRLTDHLRHDNKTFQALLALWGQNSPPPVVNDVQALSDDELNAQLPSLLHRHSTEALLLSLLLNERRAALDTWETLDESSLSSVVNDDAAQNHNATGEVTSAKSAATQSRTGDGAAEAAARAQAQRDAFEQALQKERGEKNRWRDAAHAAQKELKALQGQMQLETQTLQLRAKQEERRAAASATVAEETRKRLEREARRRKQSEAASEELQTENKRLKRQLRQAQQMHEDLRKQLASQQMKLREAEGKLLAADTPGPAQSDAGQTAEKSTQTAANTPRPKTPRQKAATPKVVTTNATIIAVSALDQPFTWNVDGRDFRVTPREVREAIDRNNEEWVFALIQGLDALRETHPRVHKRFIESVREIGRYYSRVLTVETTRVLVDASNVARYELNSRNKGQLNSLLLLRDELRRRDCFPIKLVADASLPYNIDEPQELMVMARRGEVEIVPAGVEADEILAREARRSGAYVVTNDRNFHLKVAPDFEPPRIAFRVRDGIVLVDDF
jgi:hypothetical protein